MPTSNPVTATQSEISPQGVETVTHVEVATASPFTSKINWIQLLGGLAALLNELLPVIPAQYQHYLTVAIIVLTGVSTIVARTFYTTSIINQSVPSSASILNSGASK